MSRSRENSPPPDPGGGPRPDTRGAPVQAGARPPIVSANAPLQFVAARRQVRTPAERWLGADVVQRAERRRGAGSDEHRRVSAARRDSGELRVMLQPRGGSRSPRAGQPTAGRRRGRRYARCGSPRSARPRGRRSSGSCPDGSPARAEAVTVQQRWSLSTSASRPRLADASVAWQIGNRRRPAPTQGDSRCVDAGLRRR